MPLSLLLSDLQARLLGDLASLRRPGAERRSSRLNLASSCPWGRKLLKRKD